MQINGNDVVLVRKEKTVTSLGCLSKAWYKDEITGDLYLVKGNMRINNGLVCYEPFSEAIASIVAKHIGIDCVRYDVVPNTFDAVTTYNCDYVSICKQFGTPAGYQRISAIQFMEMYYHKLLFTNFWNYYCKMPINTKFLCDMLLYDAVIGNTDRHLNNWEFFVGYKDGNIELRNTTLFDNGASLLAMTVGRALTSHFAIGCDKSKPFKDTHTKQLMLLKRTFPDYCIHLDLNAVWNNIATEIEPILKMMPAFRAECVLKYLHNRFFHYLQMFNEE